MLVSLDFPDHRLILSSGVCNQWVRDRYLLLCVLICSSMSCASNTLLILPVNTVESVGRLVAKQSLTATPPTQQAAILPAYLHLCLPANGVQGPSVDTFSARGCRTLSGLSHKEKKRPPAVTATQSWNPRFLPQCVQPTHSTDLPHSKSAQSRIRNIQMGSANLDK